MRTKRIMVALLSVLFVTATILSACGGNNSGNTGEGSKSAVVEKKGGEKVEDKDSAQETSSEVKMDKEQIYRFADGNTITTFDPQRSGAIPDWIGQSPIYENLTRYEVLEKDADPVVQPGVAESWECSEDGLTWTFKLRDNAKWSDGTPIIAKDFVYTWQRVFDPQVATDYEWMVDKIIEGGSEYYNGKGKREDVGVKALNDSTVEFKLKRPCGYFLIIASFPTYKPLKQEFVEQYGEAYGSSADKTLGNGAFMLESWQPGVSVTYVKNENYWDAENVYLTKIERKCVKEENPIAQSLMNGEIDSGRINKTEWKKMLGEDEKFTYINGPVPNLDFLMFNAKNKYLKNKKIRQALSIAFDRERFVREVWNDEYATAYSVVPDMMHCGTEVYTKMVNDENKYVKIMEEKYTDPKALLIDGLEEEGLGEDPSQVTISYISRGEGEISKKICEWTKQMYEEKLGINLEIELIPYNIMWDRVDAGDYDIASGGWTADLDLPSNLIEIFHTKTGWYPEKKTGWSGEAAEKFNELVEKADGIKDDMERAKTYCKAEKILLEEAIIAPTDRSRYSTFRAKYIKGKYDNALCYSDYKGVYIQGRE